MGSSPVYVVVPTLPPFQELVEQLKPIWDTKILTNGGPLHQRLELELCAFLGVPHLALFNNGTNALISAIQAMRLSGEVITTPYSFVATAHALLWNNLTPVFVDVNSQTLNIDADLIEAAITPETTAILAVHCYGHSCDVEKIEAIAKKHGLKVIYDAAHAFGVRTARGSVLNEGDLSVLSFHATKVFNTFEGGAIVCRDEAAKRRVDQLKNFGIVDEATIDAVGLNGKMSELNAAVGLVQIKYVQEMIEKRKRVDALYRERLASVKGLRCLGFSNETSPNYAYFPILLDKNYPLGRDALYEKFKAHNIFTRRYFYPLLSNLPMYKPLDSAKPDRLPIANAAAQHVLCLPLFPDLSVEDQMRVIDLIVEV